MKIAVGDAYVELGAVATPSPQQIDIDSSTVNTTNPGTYTVTYSVSGSSCSVSREVQVVEGNKKKGHTERERFKKLQFF